MNLGKSIYNLLKRQAEVYVKGLGSFKRNHTPATYDDRQRVFLPPISYIDFDKTSEQGYDFIQYIQQLHAIDRAEAEHLTAGAVAMLKEAIQDDGQAKLDDLGYLVSYGDSYVFKALDLTGFAYQPVEAQPDQVVFTQEQPAPESLDVESEEMASTPIKIDIEQPIVAEVLPPVEIEEEVIEERKSSNTIWYIVMAVVALGIIAALYFTNKNQEIKKQITQQIVNPEVELKDTATHITVVPDSLQRDTLGVAVVDTIEQEIEEKVTLVPQHHQWQIVIGSHKTLAQAYEQAEAYHKAGYPKVKVIPSNLAKNRKKVIWDSYGTKSEVDSALKHVQKHIIKDAWPDKIR